MDVLAPTLAATVWQIPAIRQLICRYAPKQALLGLMRCSRETFAESVKALYFEMEWTKVQRVEKKAAKSVSDPCPPTWFSMTRVWQKVVGRRKGERRGKEVIANLYSLA